MEIAKSKREILLDRTLKNAVKTVLGTALSVGVTVEREDPRVIQTRIDTGEYDDKIKED